MIPENKEYKKYTYADYLVWPDEERWELINGEAWDMSPAPKSSHQRVCREILGNMWIYLKDKPCEVFPAPFDVRLVKDSQANEQDIYTTVQPDLSVVCNKDKIDEKGCLGAPDLIVEVLSPSTALKDESQKLKLYEEYGVREYWIVNPEAEYIMIYKLTGPEFNKPDYYKGDDIIKSDVLTGFHIGLNDIFRK
ncbi:MAG: Uma2 family endonuclease [Spirochaetaceae bacterium]|nr:Uma2 family endonuclease [Spirochaetaceae bacterium]